jgi:hypothetical protein
MARMILKADSLFVHPINLICVQSPADGHVIADATFPRLAKKKQRHFLVL